MPTLVSVFGVEPFRIGGTETFARELSNQLAALGWKSVLCFQSPPNELVKHFLDLPNVTIEVVGDTSRFSRSTSSLLCNVFRRHKPEIVHLHFTGFLGIYPWLAKFYGAKKVFFTDHTSRPAGYIPQKAPYWKRQLVRLLTWPFTKVICVSAYGYRCMKELALLPVDRFELVYNAVDFTRILDQESLGPAFRQRYGIPIESPMVVQVSWIIPEKGIADILAAAKLVIKSNDKVRFVLVGEGAYREHYMQLAKDEGIAENVCWTGIVDDPFGEGVYQAAEIVCQVSRWEELFGWMIAEGMANGKPVVATRVGGIPELVIDGESGFLVERGDAEAIANRILFLLNNAQIRQSMGNKGQEHAMKNFNLRKNVEQLLGVYGLPQRP